MKLLFLLIISVSLLTTTSAQPRRPVIRLTDSVACPPVTDQGSAPVCWTFGSNSLFESDILKQHGLQVNLSEMFYARHAYIDKARQFLATGGQTYFEGGGNFHDIIRVIERYGMVPENVYPGKPAQQRIHNHAKLDTSMQRLVKKWWRLGYKKIQPRQLKQINDTLDKYLGKLPTTFRYNNKAYTSRSFADSLLHFTNEYLELVSFSDKPLYQKILLEDRYNWAADSFYNISLTDMQMVADSALAGGWSVGWEGDVTEASFDSFRGIAVINGLPDNVDSNRLGNYKTLATERDHMLHLVGAGRDEIGRRWYYLKNSWGNYGPFKGYQYMDENYFKYKTVVLLVNKAALTPSLRERLKL